MASRDDVAASVMAELRESLAETTSVLSLVTLLSLKNHPDAGVVKAITDVLDRGRAAVNLAEPEETPEETSVWPHVNCFELCLGCKHRRPRWCNKPLAKPHWGENRDIVCTEFKERS